MVRRAGKSPTPTSDYGMVSPDPNVGILHPFAISSPGVYGIITAGRSSNPKYAFSGALRSAAQMVSYEVSIGPIIITVPIRVGSRNFSEIVIAQKQIWFGIPSFPVFITSFISRPAETNRAPFDLPEAEAESVAGYNVEYSPMGFAPSLPGEYANMILMRCGALHLTLVGLQPSAGASVPSRALCSKPLRAIRRLVGPAKLSERGSLVCEHSNEPRTHRTTYPRLGGYPKWVPRNSSPDLYVYRMLIRESALLGLEPGRVAPRKDFSSHPGGADTPARITGDSYRDGGEGNGTRYPGMDVNPSNRDNHSGSGREDSPAMVDISPRGERSEPESLRRRSAKRTHVLGTIADNRQLLASYERIKSKPSPGGEKKIFFFPAPRKET